MRKYLFPGLIFAASAFLALYNIGNFPKMVGDEGIYVSQAYWLAYLGKLGPYTYWYDHSPLGWVQIGLWQRLMGSLEFFGYTVLSARVFMGLILAGTSTLLYLLTYQFTRSKLTSLLASGLFIGSALTLTFGRMVLLDNLAVYWFLLSLLFLFSHPARLRYIIISAFSLSFAILSKEALLFFLPPYLFTVYYLNRDNLHKKYVLLVSFTTCFFLLSFFPLLAVLKGELFPRPDQVSFLGTLLFQADRGNGIAFWQSGSHFREMLSVWLTIDPILILLGAGSTLILPLLPISKRLKLLPLFNFFFLIFLLRGGQIYDFYLIPLLPLLSLNIAILLAYFDSLMKLKFLVPTFILSMAIYLSTSSTYPFTLKSTTTQTQSIDALKAIGEPGVIVATNYAYLDVYLQQKHVIHWYQKIESDRLIQDSSPVITHFLIDEQFAREISGGQLPYLKSQLETHSLVQSFGKPLSPGEKVKPYAQEFLSLYEENTATEKLIYLVSLSQINDSTLEKLSSLPVSAVLLTSESFTNSSDLEGSLKLLKAHLRPQSQLLIVQDDTGQNTVPWITTPSRSFYKSPEEAASSTLKKTASLKQLGFTGAVVTSSTDKDGFLSDILQSSSPNLLPIVRFANQEIPTQKAAILVENQPDLEKLQSANYPGQIYYLVSLENYPGISN